MVGSAFKVILFFMMLLLTTVPAFAAGPISIEGLQLDRADGTEVFLDLLQENGHRIKWTSIIMEPRHFGITGEIESPRRIYPGIPSLTLRLRSGARKFSAVYRLEWNAIMVFAARNIQRGQIISAEDMDVREACYKRTYGDTFSAMALLTGKRAKRRIGSGSVISERDVEKVMVVERGARLTVISRFGGVEAKLPGLALESGSRGSTIRVRLGKYRKDIHAMIVGPGMVLVKEGI